MSRRHTAVSAATIALLALAPPACRKPEAPAADPPPAVAAAAPAPAVGSALGEPALYRHGVELTIEGPYPDLLAYLRATAAR